MGDTEIERGRGQRETLEGEKTERESRKPEAEAERDMRGRKEREIYGGEKTDRKGEASNSVSLVVVFVTPRAVGVWTVFCLFVRYGLRLCRTDSPAVASKC